MNQISEVSRLLDQQANLFEKLAKNSRKIRSSIESTLSDEVSEENMGPPRPKLEPLTREDEHANVVLSDHCKKWLLGGNGYSTWNATSHAWEVAAYFLGHRWRADRQGNFWRYTGPLTDHKFTGLNPDRENLQELGRSCYWKAAAKSSTIHQLYLEYVNHFQYIALYVNKMAGKPESKEWKNLSKQKQYRACNVMGEMYLSERKFIKIMQENHIDVLGKLRNSKCRQ